MFGHLPELFIVLIIALIVFGPEKLPEMAANAGKMVREMRAIMDDAMKPEEKEPAEDFSTYYYDSLAHSGEDVPVAESHTFEGDDGLPGGESHPELDGFGHASPVHRPEDGDDHGEIPDARQPD